MQETKSISGICTRACAAVCCAQCLCHPRWLPVSLALLNHVQELLLHPHWMCPGHGWVQVRMGLAWPPALGSSCFQSHMPRGSPPLLHPSHGLCTVESSSWQLLGRIETWYLSIQRNILGEKEVSFHKLLSNGEEQALFWGTWWVGRGMAECTVFQIFLLFSCVCMGGRKFRPIWEAGENQWRFLSIVLLWFKISISLPIYPTWGNFPLLSRPHPGSFMSFIPLYQLQLFWFLWNYYSG